ncbi:MAG TPA: hypothetical protein PKC18_05345, partial [Lacipirellulaceae bacterium]|nr:hypothetical protein [Lacipirellulaceae bacterium]
EELDAEHADIVQRRGKALLKRRLARRNVTWTLAVSAAAAAEPAAAATIDAATRGALEFASSGTSESAGAESAGLAQEEVQAMTTSLLPASTGAAVLAALGAAILGAGGLAIAQSGDSRPLALAVQAAAADADLGELDAPLLAASATREERLAPNTFVAAAPSPDLGHYSEAEREIMQALEARTATLDFASAPLSEIMDLVSDEHGIQIWFDRLAMDNMAISPETEVTATLRNVRLKSALRLILSQVELTYVVRDDALVITTVDAAQVMFDTRVYDVAIIASQIQQDELTKLIVDTVASDSWAENGTGEGEVKPAGARLLVIKQTPEVHQQVTALLRQLNAALMKDEAR